MDKIKWDIRRESRAWEGTEAMERYGLTPERFEMHGGKLFWSEKDRLRLLALLLENVGIDKAILLGDPLEWRKAIAEPRP
ncbi:MAG TPA: hypothetical protein VEF34_16300 [Syntrophobacteraceae bacterium]|nr:hypothetical protein [Syntrophobacteraceae bacterium]